MIAVPLTAIQRIAVPPPELGDGDATRPTWQRLADQAGAGRARAMPVR